MTLTPSSCPTIEVFSQNTVAETDAIAHLSHFFSDQEFFKVERCLKTKNCLAMLFVRSPPAQKRPGLSSCGQMFHHATKVCHELGWRWIRGQAACHVVTDIAIYLPWSRRAIG
jgi:hypothetical protein